MSEMAGIEWVQETLFIGEEYLPGDLGSVRDPDMEHDPVAVQVFNGAARVGDTVAYATRYGSSMHMNIATVLSIGSREMWGGRTVPTLKVHVERSTSSWPRMRDSVTIAELYRVVVL